MGVDNLAPRTTAGQRQAKRNRVLLSARLRSPFGEIDCRLRDLSRQGALIECRPVPPVGTDVVFTRGAIQVPAKVAWAGSDRAGLEFDYMIDEAEVLVQLKRTDPSFKPVKPAIPPSAPHRRPSAYGSMTGKEREAARLWGIQVGIALPD